MNYETYLTEHTAWVNHNFPNSLNHFPLLGIVEELGELIEANLNLDSKAERDAVGDILVYLTHYCKFNMLDWVNCKRFSTTKAVVIVNLLDISIEVGKLAHAHLKGEQSIRHTSEEIYRLKRNAIGNIVFLLEHHCEIMKFDLMDCLEQTWNEVKRRDWIKNNQTGT